MSTLQIGQKLERYQILAELGQGGMGVVYKAHDTRLDRDVAIKVLRRERLIAPGWRERLGRESRAASALNHPNIITIHDVSEADGVEYIVMEFVDGTTLDRLIPPDGVPLKQALQWAIAIAGALSAAHTAGLVHRDLKPGNVMIAQSGLLKVLDFGLAKVADRDATGADSTETLRPGDGFTQAGLILGSAAYMSPEQAEGRRVDVRSDIFSFGSVLYEMLAGKPAFLHESRIATLGAIARSEPVSLRSVRQNVPVVLERLVLRCLQKKPAERFQDMRDVKMALEDILLETETGEYRHIRTAPLPRWTWPVGALGLLVVAGLAYWGIERSQREAPPAPQLAPFTLDSGVSNDPAISADGQWIVYASDRAESRDIWVRQVQGGEPLQLTKDPADEHSPDFSPDGTEIVFYSGRDGGGIYTVPTLGGAPRRIADSPYWYPGPRYSPDGRWIAFSKGASQLAVVPRAGGDLRTLAPKLQSVRQPIWTPDGQHLLLRARAPGDDRSAPEWYVLPVEGGDPIAVGAAGKFRKAGLTEANPGSWLGRRVLFTGGTTDRWHVWQMSVDPSTFQSLDEPRQLTFGTGWEDHASEAANGFVALFSGTYNRDLFALPLDPSTGIVKGESQRLTNTLATDSWPSVSRDDRLMAYSSNRTGEFQVWIRDNSTGREYAATSGQTDKWGPMISPSGKLVVYTERRDGRSIVFVVPVAGGEPREIQPDSLPLDWSPDDRYLLLLELAKASVKQRVLLADLQSGQVAPLVEHPEGVIRGALFSPDGKWLAVPLFLSRETFQRYLIPFDGRQPVARDRWRLLEESIAGRNSPVWSPDSRLYWFSRIAGTLEIWAQGITPGQARFTSQPILAFHPPAGPYEISTEKLAVSHKRLYFSRWEVLGNIWTMRLDPASR